MIVDRYYYSRLKDKEKTVYREIYQGCMSHQDTIFLSVSKDDIEKSYERITTALTFDNPLLYFVNQSSMDFAGDNLGHVAAIPQYFFSKKTVSDYNKKIQDTANMLISKLKLTEGTEIDKVRRVHDYMCSSVEYDYKGADMRDLPKFIAAHNIIGVFAHKKAQCEGIAKAAKVLLNAVDVKCIFVSGKAGNTPASMDEHGWNIVKIEEDPCHMDITFDIAASEKSHIGYDYFCINDTQIKRDHILDSGLPKCSTSKYEYFVMNNMIFSSKAKLKTYIERELRSGAKSVYFKLAGKLKTSEIYDEMTKYGYEVLCDMGIENVRGESTLDKVINTCRIKYI